MDCSEKKYEMSDFSTAEQKAIRLHKYYLSEQAGCDVGEEYAIRHWLDHYSQRWRHNRLQHEMKAQKEEIRRHVWIESQKAGQDLGSSAAIDWISKHAASWRRWRELQEDLD